MYTSVPSIRLKTFSVKNKNMPPIQNIRICCIDITIAWGYVSHLIDYYVERIVLGGIQG
jgi:hypothetical protein